jgi:hypothetical protein
LCQWDLFYLPVFSHVLLPQLLSQDSVDVAALWAEVTQTREAVATVEAARVVAMLTVEASARDATAVRDGATFHIKDVEDRAALAEREALEQVSRAEVENFAALASTHNNAEGHAQKITLLDSELTEERRARETSEREHQECFNDFTLL